ncbi:hypothetical protein FXO37_30016 [Capsicum annuum]|nr:hypothetical protein FXO37_30016 [Capsicum annuum]
MKYLFALMRTPCQFLPQQFAIANGLINKKRKLILIDERQRSWKLKLSSGSTRAPAYIGDGWQATPTDHEDTPTHDKPYGQSHFECTIRRSCLSKGFMVQMLSSRFDSDSSGKLFYILCCGVSTLVAAKGGNIIKFFSFRSVYSDSGTGNTKVPVATGIPVPNGPESGTDASLMKFLIISVLVSVDRFQSGDDRIVF